MAMAFEGTFPVKQQNHYLFVPDGEDLITEKMALRVGMAAPIAVKKPKTEA